MFHSPFLSVRGASAASYQSVQIKNSRTGKEYSSVLLCSKYREGKKVNPRTVAHLSHLSDKFGWDYDKRKVLFKKARTWMLKDVKKFQQQYVKDRTSSLSCEMNLF